MWIIPINENEPSFIKLHINLHSESKVRGSAADSHRQPSLKQACKEPATCEEGWQGALPTKNSLFFSVNHQLRQHFRIRDSAYESTEK